MPMIRVNALRSLRFTGARTTARASAGRTQLVAKRFASSGGSHGGHGEASSDLPWLLSAVAITPPCVWYLWPDTSHAEHHDDHGHHGEHAEEEEKPSEEDQSTEDEAEQVDSAPAEQADAPEKTEEKAEQSSEKQEDESQGDDEKSEGGDDKEEGGEDKQEGSEKSGKSNEGVGNKDGSQGSGSDGEGQSKNMAASTPNEGGSQEKPKGGEVEGVQFKGKMKPDSDGFKDTHKTEPNPESRGTQKRRIDSGLGKNLGEGTSSSATAKPETSDVGAIDNKQKGFSTTDTRHSIKIDERDDKSKKGTGEPETAKAKGTIDPKAPKSGMAEDDNPLIKALPPASDYYTYLTIIEYNLTPENLPVLHKILQDEQLTTNIGWDLVHLLIPLLPESEECLKDIARLGNPREVILKVTESLRLIEYDGLEQDDPQSAGGAEGSADEIRSRADSTTYPLKTAATATGGSPSAMREMPPPLPLPVNQFVALLSMLAVLHPRIKTKYPTRFLSTTLQAILASFSNAPTGKHREEMVVAIVKTIKAVTGIQRPTLPSRKSSGMLPSSVTRGSAPAADPEASAVSGESLEESDMQTKLLQAFVTHVLEEYMLNFPSYEDVPGMAWCSRIMEKVRPERTIPDATTFKDRFANEERLHRRIDAVGQLANLSQDLRITDEQLFEAAITVEDSADGNAGEEIEPPADAKDVALSRLGSLVLFAGREVSTILYDRPRASRPAFELFPDHQDLLKHCLAPADMGTGQLGTEPAALIDAVLSLGLVGLERDAVGDPVSDEQFNEYLQVIALLSSNCPNPSLRGHAHYLASTVLRSQPDEQVRLSFIRDTLEHCPFENLKVSAVGWIKGETIEANTPTPVSGHAHQHESDNSKPSIFSKPLALDSLAPYLFPSLHVDLVMAPIRDAWMTFQTNISFYLASLNFLYLLLQAKHIYATLDIHDLWTNNDIAGSFLQPLRDVKKRFLQQMDDGALEEEKSAEAVAELGLLEETVSRVTRVVANLNGE
ncbi:hypothetical protein DOTSEDRAFT_86567 [Dothistroma septosporum NZE10]|uniref:DUF1760-domain-containing protein n=1 Tax=Dothistroma septosporum (strain NZE10 / CBS 128990) TaxID=675120 RepID=N1PXM1_DOTSN|nr:hypothetical protein DOTSEDRAFT_86567 [Dothistroma septosporum NZE10]